MALWTFFGGVGSNVSFLVLFFFSPVQGSSTKDVRVMDIDRCQGISVDPVATPGTL